MKTILPIILLIIFSTANCQQNQKSFLIVFDGTGSMSEDLAQLRSGAYAILNDFSSRANNPIYNYVLVVFRDPDIEETLNTTDPNDIIESLARINVTGGGDCPELSITGLKNALDHALPKSIAFVFTDASAKDYELESEVLQILWSKQATVNFLTTGDCGHRGRPNFNVYYNLARASNGQVYNMQRNDIGQVLEASKVFADDDYVELESIISDTPGTQIIYVNIDESINEIIVSVSGYDPILKILDPNNQTVELDCKLELDALLFGCIKDPISGMWTFEISVDSAYSIKLGAKSDLDFDFGFSTGPVSSIDETTIQPLISVENILSIFPNVPALVGNLTHITITTIPSNSSSDGDTFDIELTKINDAIYASNPFEIPEDSFVIILHGEDSKGNKIDRLLSTTLRSTEASPPEVTVTSKEDQYCEGGDVSLTCLIKSQIPATVEWYFNEEVIETVHIDQSRAIELRIEKATVDNSGNYSCIANNSKGSASESMQVTVKKFPNVAISEWLSRYVDFTVKCDDQGIDIYPKDELLDIINNAEACSTENEKLKSENEELKEALELLKNDVDLLQSNLESETAEKDEISKILEAKTDELSCCNRNVSLIEKQLKTCKEKLNGKASICKDDDDSGESNESREIGWKKNHDKSFEFFFKFKN